MQIAAIKALPWKLGIKGGNTVVGAGSMPFPHSLILPDFHALHRERQMRNNLALSDSISLMFDIDHKLSSAKCSDSTKMVDTSPLETGLRTPNHSTLCTNSHC